MLTRATRVRLGLLIAGTTVANIAMMTPSPSSASSGAATHEHAALQRLLDRAVAVGGVPGILAEVRDGGRHWSGTAGVADTATGRARRARDRYRIGSTTKTFVATVMLQLVAEHKVSLDDTVDRWLPGVVRGNGHDGGAITVRRLLDHTSGIFNYTDDQAALSRYPSPTPEQLLDIAMSHPPAFAPGTSWAYSNTNYILAGLIIERASGGTLADEIATRIARPLRLAGTYLPRGADPVIHGPHSQHYTKKFQTGPDAVVYDATEMDTSLFWATGAMISTAGDLNRFFRALLSGRLLPAAQQREMFTMVPTKDWIAGSAYGLGISSVTLSCGTTVWGMGGALFGSFSYTYGTRDGEHMLAINVNGDWTDGGWEDPIGIFTDALEVEFRPGDSRAPRRSMEPADPA
ncbi:serine hydrolase domain-containing protein [Sphaerisporangium sp. NPDC005289]|uniref:serine hydrolase domain-containing protein n=1 Tax=Sphaerisporangium sp. NPDC005289 TaxID=3155247 RepID=UPI0033B7A8C2